MTSSEVPSRKLVFLRHGESIWNQARRFTGWADVPLSKTGELQALQAGQLLKSNSYTFDVCFSSYLRRSIDTLHIVSDTLGIDVPVHRSWRLNERHYGALQGLNRDEVRKQYGSEQVTVWQQQFEVAPPPLETGDVRFPGHDPRYAKLAIDDLPRTETLKQVRSRALIYWNRVIVPEVKRAQRILVVAHGNSIRALTTYLDGVAENDIPGIKRPLTGEPFVYEFGQDAMPLRSYSIRPAPKLKRWGQKQFRRLTKSARPCAE